MNPDIGVFIAMGAAFVAVWLMVGRIMATERW